MINFTLYGTIQIQKMSFLSPKQWGQHEFSAISIVNAAVAAAGPFW